METQQSFKHKLVLERPGADKTNRETLSESKENTDSRIDLRLVQFGLVFDGSN